MRKVAYLTVFLIFSISFSVHALTMDFEDLGSGVTTDFKTVGNYHFFTTYTSVGFKLQTEYNEKVSTRGLVSHSENSAYYTDSARAAIFGNSSNKPIVLSMINGGLFSLESIWVRHYFNRSNYSGEITFSALDGNNNLISTVGKVFTDRGSWTEIIFGDEFKKIASVSWNNTSGGYHQFDDIVVTPAPVPEPATVFLLGLGLIALLALKYKRA